MSREALYVAIVALTVFAAALTGVTGTVDFLATAAPELAGPESTAGAACGGCYVVADVAALVWYSQAFVNTATAMVSVGAGNGTRGTRTSIVSPEGQFTFSPEAGSPGGAVLSAVPYQPTINVNGAILTSPTAYNVFTAYSVTSAVLSGGVCSTVSGPRMLLPQAYTEVVPQANGRVVLDQNGEQQFIKQLGFSSCSGGGVSIVPTALVPVSSTTMTTTQSFSSNVPLAAMTVGTAPSVSNWTLSILPSHYQRLSISNCRASRPGGLRISVFEIIN